MIGILTVAFGVISVVSVVLGAIALRLMLRSRYVLSYQMRTVRYFDQDTALPEGASMTFLGTSVDSLAKTTIVAWNSGTDTLQGKDIVESNPLRLEFDKVRLMEARIVGSTQDTNGVRVTRTGDVPHLTYADQVTQKARVGFSEAEESPNCSLEFSYEYLSPNDGFVLEVVHNSRKDPTFVGTCKGLSRGGANDLGKLITGTIETIVERSVPRSKTVRVVLLVNLVSALLVIAALIASGLALDWGFLPKESSQIALVTTVRPYLYGTVFVQFLLHMTATLSFGYWTSRRRYPKELAEYM